MIYGVIYSLFVLIEKLAFFNKQFGFFIPLKTKWSDLSFAVHKGKENLFIQVYRKRVNNCLQWRKVRGAARFSFHVCRYVKEMLMLHDLLVFWKSDHL